MKTHILPILLVLTAGALHAELHTFTSPDGRTLDGEITAATPDMVTLKLASGQSITAPINKFSDNDQEFIIQWRKQNPQTIKYAFAASYAKQKTGSTETTQGATTITTESWVCNMKIANRSGTTLERLKVDYEVFYNQEAGNSTVLRKSIGSTSIGSIKHLQELSVPTQPVKLATKKLQGGYYYADGARSRQKDTLLGMTIKISHEGKEVFSWTSYGVPERGVTADGKSGTSLFDQ